MDEEKKEVHLYVGKRTLAPLVGGFVRFRVSPSFLIAKLWHLVPEIVSAVWRSTYVQSSSHNYFLIWKGSHRCASLTFTWTRSRESGKVKRRGSLLLSRFFPSNQILRVSPWWSTFDFTTCGSASFSLVTWVHSDIKFVGNTPEPIIEMANLDLFKGHIDGVDINCGCPQGFAMKVVTSKSISLIIQGKIGAAMLHDPDLLVSLCREVGAFQYILFHLQPPDTQSPKYLIQFLWNWDSVKVSRIPFR